MYRHAVLERREAPYGALPGRASIFVVLRDVDEIALVEESGGLVVGGEWFGHYRRDSALFAFPDLLAIEVTPIGKRRKTFIADRLAGLSGHWRELLSIMPTVGYVVGDDQMVFGIDRCL